MAEKLDISKFKKDRLEILRRHISAVIDRSKVDGKELDDYYNAVEDALQLRYPDMSSDRIQPVERIVDGVPVRKQETDGESGSAEEDLYYPALHQIAQTLLVRLKKFIFPVDSSWFGFKMQNNKFFRTRDVSDFIPNYNLCWENIIDKENVRFDIQSEYNTGLFQTIAYGETAFIHYFDEDQGVVRPLSVNARDVQFFPKVGNWRRSARVYKYLENYENLLSRSDYDQELVRAIDPRTQEINTDVDNDHHTKSSSMVSTDLDDFDIPAGKVLLRDIKFPSLFLADDSGEIVIDSEKEGKGHGLVFTVAYQPKLRQGKDKTEVNGGSDVFILSAKVLEYEGEDGLIHGTYGTTLPNITYHKGPLIPLLDHQAFLNQIFTGMSVKAAMNADPPMKQAGESAAFNDFDQIGDTEEQTLQAGKIYPPGMDLEPIFGPNGIPIENDIATIQFVVQEMEKSVGITAQNIAGGDVTKKTATEISQSAAGADDRQGDAGREYDRQILKNSLAARVEHTQQHLIREIEELIGSSPLLLDQFEALEEEEQDQLLERALPESDLFNRLKEFSNIEELYREFFVENREEIAKQEQLTFDILMANQEVGALKDQIEEIDQTEFEPPPPIPNPETGLLEPAVQSEEEMQQLAQQFEEQKLQAKEQMALEMQQTQTQIDIMKNSVKRIKPAPEYSDALAYRLLTHPVKVSDVVITGSSTSLNRELEMNNLDRLLGIITNVPTMLNEYDVKKLSKRVARVGGVNYRDVALDPEDRVAQEQRLKEQMMLEQGNPQQMQ